MKPMVAPIDAPSDSPGPSAAPAVIVGCLLLGAVLVVSTAIGTVETIDWRAALAAAVGASDDPVALQIVQDFRVPRILVAMLVGAQMAVSGAILQAITRNALAAPSLIGVSGGAGLAAVLVVLFLPSAGLPAVAVAAFIGAVLSGSLVYALSWKRGIAPERLALTGIAVTAILTAIITAIVTFYAENSNIQAALVWLTGTVYGRGWIEFWTLIPWFVVTLTVTWLLAHKLNVLLLGDGVAAGLGMRVERARIVFIALAVALAAGAVAVAGLIAFVGLVVPHVVRMLFGSDQRRVVPLSAIGGAILMVIADDIARMAFDRLELPAGLMTALIGAPYFIYLISRKNTELAV